ncbi:MAG: AmmeMemoRadiSam system radical SAM enzyme [Desulfobacteraceae bacterium]|nr:AmmeMemoRadiSam system radical SAM enzyme [Desulfobacteraceae bacterium]
MSALDLTISEAMFYQPLADGVVRCALCRMGCRIGPGERGRCGVRENQGGVLVSLVYGRLCAEHLDPIEKKPLFHVLPGSLTYSIAAPGCNFRCRHCQNYAISQVPAGATIQGVVRRPEEVVARAMANRCPSLSYTYTEPTVAFEFALHTARLARRAGLKNIFVTNGYISPEALAAIAPVLDAANIDLKGFGEPFYREVVGAKLSAVLDTIIDYRRHGIWVELTTLIIPGLNDSEAELKGIASFIINHLGADTPWHVSQFYPTYQLTDRPRTPVATLRLARDLGQAAGLRYVYEGNVPGAGGEDTRCPACAVTVITRRGFTVLENRLRQGHCPDCGAEIAGVGL